MRVLVINVLDRAAIERDQPVVNVRGSRMDRLFTQTRQAGLGAAHHRGDEDGLPLADAACRARRHGRLVVTQPANEIAHHGMQLRSATLIRFDNSLQLLRQIQPVAGDHQHIRNLL